MLFWIVWSVVCGAILVMGAWVAVRKGIRDNEDVPLKVYLLVDSNLYDYSFFLIFSIYIITHIHTHNEEGIWKTLRSIRQERYGGHSRRGR